MVIVYKSCQLLPITDPCTFTSTPSRDIQQCHLRLPLISSLYHFSLFHTTEHFLFLHISLFIFYLLKTKFCLLTVLLHSFCPAYLIFSSHLALCFILGSLTISSVYFHVSVSACLFSVCVCVVISTYCLHYVYNAYIVGVMYKLICSF